MINLFKYLKPSHKKAQVILFPRSRQSRAAKSNTDATIRYVADLLRDKGYEVESHISLDNMPFDIRIPTHRCMIYCSTQDKTDILDIIYQKKLRKISYKNGYRFYVVHTSHFYKDLIEILTKLRFNTLY
ncbi:hypothetical protein GCM10011391_29290 [Pullulanibacillus camelliae]|uniref:Uncharacterized protein n=1 Tax=Pullulanibacillus camelliae TaxID=1707096 RepID=A0A8J2YK26_9BACL|nr:hypothetical protein [Pullulanibacillus camelliae]GGE48602.1 hypothetical protein GCM10011391_29290 [Pullulanibacillus camelliae]